MARISTALLSAVLLFAVVLMACGSDETSTGQGSPADPASPANPADPTASELSQICPSTIKVLSDWFPEPEHNYLYQAIGVNGVVDAANGTYTGPIGDGSVELVIQAGGPYINSLSQTIQFYSDDSLFMAFVDTSDAIKSHASTPVVAVFSNFEVGPQLLMWNPEVHDFDSFADIGESGVTVSYYGGSSYMDYLLHLGILEAGQVEGTYDGSPGRFITQGDLVQGGFATNEPYRYENEIEGWLKPVDFLLVHDAGHDIYQSALSVKPETVAERGPCLRELVPLFQQALVDYMHNPDPVNERLVEIVVELDSFWTSTLEANRAAVVTMRELGFVSDGDNDYVGDMDEGRIQGLIDKLTPVFAAQGVSGFGGGMVDLVAADIFTNQFIDTSIGLGY